MATLRRAFVGAGVSAILIGLLWAAGCGSDAARSYFAGRYWPLAAGDQWEYRVRYADGRTATSRLLTEAPIGMAGATVFPQRKLVNGADLLRIYPLAETKDGIAIAGTDSSAPAAGTIRFSPPLLIPTTLLRLLAGIEEPDAGVVSFRRLSRLAYVPQHPEFPSDQTVAATGTGVGAATASARLEVRFVGRETVTVPAGTFPDCLQFTLSQTALDAAGQRVAFGQSPSRTWWLAEQVGLVKATDSGNDTAELLSARVGGRSYP